MPFFREVQDKFQDKFHNIIRGNPLKMTQRIKKFNAVVNGIIKKMIERFRKLHTKIENDEFKIINKTNQGENDARVSENTIILSYKETIIFLQRILEEIIKEFNDEYQQNYSYIQREKDEFVKEEYKSQRDKIQRAYDKKYDEFLEKNKKFLGFLFEQGIKKCEDLNQSRCTNSTYENKCRWIQDLEVPGFPEFVDIHLNPDSVAETITSGCHPVNCTDILEADKCRERVGSGCRWEPLIKDQNADKYDPNGIDAKNQKKYKGLCLKTSPMSKAEQTPRPASAGRFLLGKKRKPNVSPFSKGVPDDIARIKYGHSGANAGALSREHFDINNKKTRKLIEDAHALHTDPDQSTNGSMSELEKYHQEQKRQERQKGGKYAAKTKKRAAKSKKRAAKSKRRAAKSKKRAAKSKKRAEKGKRRNKRKTKKRN